MKHNFLNMSLTRSLTQLFSCVLTTVLISSCATNSQNQENSNINSNQQAEYDANGDLEKFRVSEAEQEKSQIPQINASSSNAELESIPIEINEKVEMWIRYFQGRGRKHMERYLARSTRYEALMKKVLRDNKLPEDLFYIALIESGFSSRAYSHASAVGYWQFIRGTGKRYKLQINKMVDERRDPVLATQAAAEYFRDLYTIFNSWYLSMASYNVGEGRVIRVVKKYRTRDFWELSRIKKALPTETDNYVPKYLAAKLIAKNPDRYGFEGIDYMTPIEFDNITLSEPVNLRLMAEKMNINYEDFKDLNPKYKGEIAPTENGSLSLRIPPGSTEVAMMAAQSSVASLVEYIPDDKDTREYKVRRGDNLAKVAKKFRTSIAYLRELNDFSRKKRIKVGQVILVPDRTPVQQRRTKSSQDEKKNSNKKRATKKSEYKYYVVRSNETFASIAAKHGMTLAELNKLNKLKRKTTLKQGDRIKVAIR